MEGGGTLYRGTSMDQDGRFSNKDKKLMKQINWPPEFSIKVDIKKVDLNVIKLWIHRKIIEYLGDEDDVLIDYIVSALEQPNEKGLNPKELQIHLTGFLEKNASAFMKELWNLLIEAQNSPDGIPSVLVQERKDEIRQQRQEIEESLNKLENIKAFMGGSAKPGWKEDEGMAIEKEDDDGQGRRSGKERTSNNIAKLANKLKNDRDGDDEKDGDKAKTEDVDKKHRDRERDRDRRSRDKERDRERDRDRDRRKRDDRRGRDDRRRSHDRERGRERSERDRLKERDRRKDREREREREKTRDKKDDRKRSSRQDKKKARSSSSSSDGSSSSESRERSESAEKKKEKRDQKAKRKHSEDDKDKKKTKSKKKDESSSSESGSDDSSDSGSESGSGSGSDSDSSSDNSEAEAEKTKGRK